MFAKYRYKYIPSLRREVQGKRNRALVYIFPAISFALLINITKFLEIEVDDHCVDFTHCDQKFVTAE